MLLDASTIAHPIGSKRPQQTRWNTLQRDREHGLHVIGLFQAREIDRFDLLPKYQAQVSKPVGIRGAGRAQFMELATDF